MASTRLAEAQAGEAAQWQLIRRKLNEARNGMGGRHHPA
jgi:hypothetical protein